METLIENAVQYFMQHPIGGVLASMVGYYLLRKFFFTLAIVILAAAVGLGYYGK